MRLTFMRGCTLSKAFISLFESPSILTTARKVGWEFDIHLQMRKEKYTKWSSSGVSRQ